MNGIILAMMLVSCTEIIPEPEKEEEVTPPEKEEENPEPPEVIASDAYFVSPDGNDNNPGTSDKPWATWGKAFNSSAVNPGDTVYFRGGIYEPASLSGGKGYACTRNGQPDNYVHYFAYPGEKPILDCDDIRVSGTKNYPVYMRYLSYVHFKGLTIRNVWQTDGDDEVTGWHIGRSENVIVESCVVHSTHGLGFGATACNELYYINCDSYDHCDELTAVPANNPMPGNDGTGFLDFNWNTSSTKVYYQDCRAWYCGDQGFSAGSNGYTEYDGCWSFNNGRMEGGGHGFKMGWVADVDRSVVNRLYKNCVAAYNRKYGFDSNDQGYHCGALRLYNNTSYHNGYKGPRGAGFIVYNTRDEPQRELERIYKNNISYANEHGDIFLISDPSYTHQNNSWDSPPDIKITSATFISTDSTGLSGARRADGSLPKLDFLKLNPSSAAVDAGTKSTGLPYSGSAPDLGAYEAN